jgi:tetratricopeptide (TPR) repeat protein
MKSVISNFYNIYVSKFVRVGILLATLPVILTFPNSVSAQEEEEGRRAPPAARSSQSLSRPVYERLEEIMELRDEGDIAGADAVLLELRDMHDRGRLNDAEELSMWRFYANFAALEENYEEAIIYQELILAMDEDALTPDAREAALLLLGQLKFAVEDYEGSIETYLQYLAMSLDPDIAAYQRISIAYYTLEDYQNSLNYILEFMDQTRALGEEVDKGTYELARSLFILVEDLNNALQLTREMIVLFKEPGDWEFMVNVLGALERFEEQAYFIYAMNTFGFVDSQGQIINLSGQMFNTENYWGAAKVLKQGLDEGLLDSDEDNWSRLAQSYQLAREDELAVEPYITAAEMAEDGEMYSRLSSIYINLSQFEEAVDALENAFEKGDLDRPDQAYIRQARALLELNRHDEGLVALRLAARDERSEEVAATWLRYMENEKNLYETKQRQREFYQGFFR